MSIILWIIFGAIVGWVASMIMKSRLGLVWDIILGMLGAIVGGWIATLLGLGTFSLFNFWNFVISVIGACLVIFIARLVTGRDKA